MIKKAINYLNEDPNRKLFIFSFISAAISLAYSIYNGYLGIAKLSLFNGSICIYYILLLTIKAIILTFEKRRLPNDKSKKPVIILSFALLFIITSAMVTPIILMINDEREYNFGLIPAIAMAAYTTYSFVTAIINMKKAKSSENDYEKQFRLIKMVSVLMSIVVLQNTLIIANGGYDEDMRTLSIYTSFAILAVVLIIIVYSLISYLKRYKGNE